MRTFTRIFVAIFIMFVNSQLVLGDIILRYDNQLKEYNDIQYTIKIDGEEVVGSKGYVINNRTLVPVRAIFEKIGGIVEWDGLNKEVSIKFRDNVVLLKIDNNLSQVNGNDKMMDVPAKLINDRTMVPIRFVAENIGYEIGWFPENKLITMDLKKEINEVNKEANPNQQYNSNENNTNENSQTPIITETPTPTPTITETPTPTIIETPTPTISETPTKIVTPTVTLSPNVNTTPTSSTEVAINGELRDAKYSLSGYLFKLEIDVENYSKYEAFSLTDPNRLVIDFYNTKKLKKLNDIVNGLFVKSVRYGQYEESISRVVIDLDGPCDYVIDNNSGFKVYLLPKNGFGSIDNKDEKIKFFEEKLNNINQVFNFTNLINVSYYKENEDEVVKINSEVLEPINIFRLTDDNRIVIDIKNSLLKDDLAQLIEGVDKVSKIRYASYDGKVRVVIDLKNQYQYESTNDGSNFVVRIKNKVIKNLKYSNSSSRVGIYLNDIKLTNEWYDKEEYFKGKYSEDKLTYTMSFDKSLGVVEKGVLSINDSYVESIESIPDDINNNILVKCKAPMLFNTDYRSAVNNTAITIINKSNYSKDKFIVIDPGHGDLESGAVYEDAVEKVLNLDISKKLKTLLEKQGCSVYITREDDSYIGLYERAHIANLINPKLFMSVHNNAYLTTSIGSETLYNPDYEYDTISNYRFAKIIQKSLIDTLGSVDRGLQQRPLLVVLKGTKMPAVLTEIGFLTNKSDREKLMTEEFRKLSAEALCKGVLEAFNEIK